MRCASLTRPTHERIRDRRVCASALKPGVVNLRSLRRGGTVTRVVLGDLELRVVKPYYLKMMGLNSLRGSDALIAEVAGVAHTVKSDDVVRLLRIAWRERVMGAWYSILVTEPPVPTEVLHALETSHGTLDAPCLTAAAISLVGPEAMRSIITYHERAVEHHYGGEGVIQAAASFPQRNDGADNPLPEPTDSDSDYFARLMGVVSALRRHFDE